MNSFSVAAGVVLPMAMTMGVGVIMRLTGITDRATMKRVDTIIFKVLLPLLMFYNIYKADLSELRSPAYILYGICGLFLIFIAALLLAPKLIRPAPTAAAFGQAMLRPNYLLFGVAVAQSLYGAGNVGIMMLMGAVGVPAFNAMSTVLLEAGRNSKSKPGQIAVAVLKNPNIIAAILGIAVKLSGLRLPGMVLDVVADLSALSAPLSFLSLGVSLDLAAIAGKGRLLASGLAIRLALIPLIMLIPAALLGFHGQQLCALLLLFGAPTAVASYPMAVAMDADGELAGQLVAFTTLFSLITLFMWTAVLTYFGLL